LRRILKARNYLLPEDTDLSSPEMLKAIERSEQLCSDLPLEELTELNASMIKEPENAWKVYMAVVRRTNASPPDPLMLGVGGRPPMLRRCPPRAVRVGSASQISRVFGADAVTAEPEYVPGSFSLGKGEGEEDDGTGVSARRGFGAAQRSTDRRTPQRARDLRLQVRARRRHRPRHRPRRSSRPSPPPLRPSPRPRPRRARRRPPRRRRRRPRRRPRTTARGRGTTRRWRR